MESERRISNKSQHLVLGFLGLIMVATMISGVVLARYIMERVSTEY